MFTFKEYKNCHIDRQGFGAGTRYDICTKDGEIITSINYPNYGESESIIAVRDHSENAGMLDWLMAEGVVIDFLKTMPSGFILIPVVQIDVEALMAL